jgi:hypothetical protein
MRPYRVLLRGQGVFFAAQSSAGCITNISGFDLRQAHRAGRASTAAGAGMRSLPRLVGMVLADPAGVLAAEAVNHAGFSASGSRAGFR